MIEQHCEEGLRKLTFSDQCQPEIDVGMHLVEDPKIFNKTASVTFDCMSDELKPDKDHTGIHVVALGDFEHYGCFFAGAPVQTITGQKPIETVRTGELVLTHNNRYRKVLETFETPYDGVRTAITCSCMPEPVVSTANQPYKVVRASKYTPKLRFKHRKAGTFEKFIDQLVSESEWVSADNIQPGDFMIIPCNPVSPESIALPDSADPYLMGLYLAEGRLGKEYKDISIKFALSREARFKFLAGYFDGDGCVDDNSARPHCAGTVKASTVSRTLAFDLQKLCASVGVTMSVSLEHNYTNHRKGCLPIYVMIIDSNDSNTILAHCRRLKPHDRDKVGGSSLHTSGNYALVPVTEVLSTLVENEVKFNLEVEEDNSYVVDYQVHNSNRNGDGFPKKACQTYHNTFVKHGHVFEGHNNSDRSAALGNIIKSAYNEPMGRVELFIHAHKNKAQKHLHKLAEEGEASFSMACLLAGTLIVTRRGTKMIEDIRKGDIVLTHTGEWHRVGNLSVRTVDEYLRVRLVSWGRTHIEITPNHEVLAVCSEDIPSPIPLNSTGRRTSTMLRRHRHHLYKFAKWIPAGELTSAHYMLMPIDRKVDTTVDGNWARVLGYYIAEGSFAQGVTQFTCNVDDAAVTELPKLAPWTSVTVRPKANSDIAVNVECFGTDLQQSINDSCGSTGVCKHIPLEIQHSDIDSKLHFMAAWFNGDGWQDMDGIHWITHYRALAIDLQRLLASCNIPSSCCRIDHPYDRGIVKSAEAAEYVINVSNYYSDLFAYISKAGCIDLYGRSKCRTFITGDYLAVPVAEVEHVRETVPVYNFSVNRDESYTAYGLSVHNCRVPFDRCQICGTLRKSASDPNQCEHIRDHLGRTFADGKVACTQNDFPTWFDISFVDRPADRIAWNLKVAMDHERTDAVKQAESSGLWVPDELEASVPGYKTKLDTLRKLADLETHYKRISSESSLRTGYDRYLWDLGKAASAVPDDIITELRSYSPETVFAKLAEAGVVLSAPAFYKYACGLDYGELADDMDAILADVHTGIFGRLHKQGGYQHACRNTYFDVDTYRLKEYGDRNSNELSRSMCYKVASVGALIGPNVEKRIIDTTLCGRQPEIYMPSYIKAASNAMVHKGAEIYAAYKLSALSAIGDYHKQANWDRLLALAAVQNLVK